MGAITTGVGLMSGLNIQDIVTKLMAIERIPLTQLENRVKVVDAERAAIGDLSARILAIKSALAPLKNASLFQGAKATSSHPDILAVTTSGIALPGVHRLRIQQLATSQQLVSRGVADANRTPIGSGRVVITSAQARLAQATSLDFLNAQRGVSRGRIRITDGSGASAVVDLSAASTLDDVVRAIHSAEGVAVRAEVRDDRLVIVDLSGQTVAPLTVAEVDGGRTARDLGIAGTGIDGQIVGADIHTIGEDTSLALLNDGNGVGIEGVRDDIRFTAADGTTFTVSLADRLTTQTHLAVLNGGQGVRLGTIRVTDSEGTATEVDLAGATTIAEVMQRIQTAVKANVAITGNRLLVTDTAGGNGKLIIEDVSGHAAADLGIAGASSGAQTKDPESITGEEIYHVRTIGDVLRAIQHAAGNSGAITATLDPTGKNIVLKDHTSGSGELTVEALNGSTAADDLGLTVAPDGGELTGRRLIATLNTTMLRSLNGGQGIRELGQIRVRDRAGNESVFDLTGARTVDDVLEIIAAQPGGAQVQAELSGSGLGLVIRDISGGTGILQIEDVVGTTAQDLRISGQTDREQLNGGTLYRQFVSGASRLSDLNGGAGIAAGQFRITDSAGGKTIINLSKASEMTLQEVIAQINSQADNANVQARLNDTGDGIVVIDLAGGPLPLKIEDLSSTTAADLRIAGTTEPGQDRIDGRLSVEIDVGVGDSLNDLAAHLSKASHLLDATVINDRSTVSPYRLLMTASRTGTRGELAIDSGELSIEMSTLVKAADAVVYFGGEAGGLPVTSSTNQLRGLIPNVTIDLLGTGEQTIEVRVERDTDKIVETLKGIADRVTETLGRITELTKYNAETNERGILLGDATVDYVRTTLHGLLNERVSTGGPYSRLSDLGFSLGSGGTLQFDEEAFRAAFERAPDEIRRLFTDEKEGLFKKLDDALAALANRGEGVLSVRDETLMDRQQLFSERIEHMNVLLASKEKQLYAQYQAMEAALAQLQGQQAALASLSALAASMQASSKAR